MNNKNTKLLRLHELCTQINALCNCIYCDINTTYYQAGICNKCNIFSEDLNNQFKCKVCNEG